MPAEIYGEKYRFLPKPELLSFEEIERLARILVPLGVEKLRITGGEPLLRHELPRLLERLARVPGVRDLTLTTNGFLLAGQARTLAAPTFITAWMQHFIERRWLTALYLIFGALFLGFTAVVVLRQTLGGAAV